MSKFKSIGSYRLIKENQFKELTDKIAAQETEIASATAFIKEIEKGNLETTSIDNVDLNSLTGSLVTMRNKMKSIAEEEKERNWIAEGLAKFSDILRSNNNDLRKLSNVIISELVKYMNANQGGLYLINNPKSPEEHIELIAAYAYGRQKYIKQKIEMGEGLIGQAALEKETIYIKDVPEDYIRITSGLGEALPRNLIIVPLKLEEEVYGLVELASFKEIKNHHIQFVEKLSETLASTIAAVKNTERTQNLLKDSQLQTEQLRAQEEEVRQNMEELSATQEEMHRVLNEVQRKEHEINEIINASKDSIMTVDTEYKIMHFNKAFTSLFPKVKIEKGIPFSRIFSGEELNRRVERYKQAFEGKTVEILDHLTKPDGTEMYYKASYIPLYDSHGHITMAATFVIDITEVHQAKQKAEQQAEEVKAQEEEIRQSMEELSATQEEMQRILTEVQKSEKEINELINVSSDAILTIDDHSRVLLFNKALANSFKNFKIEKGFDTMTLYNAEEQKAVKALHQRAFAGEIVETITHLKVGENLMHYKLKYSPLFDVNGKANSIAIFASDVTEIVNAKEKAEQSAEEAQQQAEELRAQEEEIRQNMEELSATQEEMQRILNEVQKNEEEFKGIINVSNDSIFTLDRNYRIIRFNNTYVNSFKGLHIEKGFDVFDMYKTDEEKKRRKDIFDQVFAGKTLEIDSHIEADGHDSYYHVKYSPHFDNEKKITSLVGIATDVTQLYKAKKSLEVREDVFGYTTILSEADLKGTITYVNKKLCEVSKYSEKELIGKGHNIFRHRDMPKELFKLFWQTIQKGEVFKGIIKNKAKDGSHYWVDATVVPVKNEKGNILKYVGARYHITDDDIAKTMYNKQAKKLKLPELK